VVHRTRGTRESPWDEGRRTYQRSLMGQGLVEYASHSRRIVLVILSDSGSIEVLLAQR
jgi:hypothetical protein